MPHDETTAGVELTAEEQALAAAVAARAEDLERWARFLWDHPEVAHQERRSAGHLVEAIDAAGGFAVETGAAGLDTAFVARTAGGGQRTVVFLAEYDALPGLSNVPEAREAPVADGGPGHGCHHHLLGAASVLAALTLQRYLVSTGTVALGDVWIVGCPAEEADGAKVQLVQEGIFTEADLALTWHPETATYACGQGSLAIVCLTASFHGRASHAAMAPQAGRSALDAALLFVHGLDLLREHVPEGARIHYTLHRGGEQPNVVPNHAEVEVYLRARRIEHAEELLGRVAEVARGADRMAWTNWVGNERAGYRAAELRVDSAYWPTLHNPRGTAALQEVLSALGPLPFSEQDQSEARSFQRAFGVPADGLNGAPDGVPTAGAEAGSSDVGDVSWNVPLVELNATTLPVGIALHSWAAVACGTHRFALQGALRAAQAMAIMGHRYLASTPLQHEIAQDFAKTTAQVTWHGLAGTKVILTPTPPVG